jgi:hypothetical protein
MSNASLIPQFDAKWFLTAREYPELVMLSILHESTCDQIFSSCIFEKQNVLELECWTASLAGVSSQAVSEYVDRFLASSASDDLKEQVCFLGTSLGCDNATRHLYRQVTTAFDLSPKRKVNLSSFLNALYLGSDMRFPELSERCEIFIRDHKQSTESRSSAEAVLIVNAGDFARLHRRILELKNDGLACGHFIGKLPSNSEFGRKLVDSIDDLCLPNQIALIESLCSHPNDWVLNVLMNQLRKKQKSGWFRGSQGLLLKKCVISQLELFCDSESEIMLRELADSKSELSIEAGCVLLQRFPNNHGMPDMFVKQCASEIDIGLRTFFLGSSLSKSRVRLRHRRVTNQGCPHPRANASN